MTIPGLLELDSKCSNAPVLPFRDLTARSIPLVGKSILESLPKSTYTPVIATQHAPYIRIFRHVYRHPYIRNLVVTGAYMLRANIRPGPSAPYDGLPKDRRGYLQALSSPLLFLDTRSATDPPIHPSSPGDRKKWMSIHNGFPGSHQDSRSHSHCYRGGYW